MGIYCNPTITDPEDKKLDYETAKIKWLRKNGELLKTPPTSDELLELDDDKRVVCLVLNSTFTAAGVIPKGDVTELSRWRDPTDQRIKFWLVLPVDAINEAVGESYRDQF